MLRSGFSSKTIIEDVSTQHFHGALDSESEKELVQLHASPALIEALKSGKYAAPETENLGSKKASNNRLSKRNEWLNRRQNDRPQNSSRTLALESDSETYLRLLCRRKDLIAAILILSDLVELTPGERTYLLSKVPEPAKPARRNGN
jgi:hypothetical protein